MNKKLLFAIIAVVLCIGMVGGAFSYFTAKVSTNSNVLQAGKESLEISNDNINWNTTTSDGLSIPVMAPGQSYTTGNIYFYNNGTLPAQAVYAQVTGLPTGSDLSQYIEVTAMGDSPSAHYGVWESTSFDPGTTNGQDMIAAFLDFWVLGPSATNNYAYWVGQNHPYISLWDLQNVAELQTAKPGISFFEYDGFDTVAVPFVGVSGEAAINITFKLADNVPESYNGASTAFNINFWGASEYNTVDPVTNYLAP